MGNYGQGKGEERLRGGQGSKQQTQSFVEAENEGSGIYIRAIQTVVPLVP